MYCVAEVLTLVLPELAKYVVGSICLNADWFAVSCDRLNNFVTQCSERLVLLNQHLGTATNHSGTHLCLRSG